MNTHTKRSAVYLTDTQRDLVVSALKGLRVELFSAGKSLGWEAKLADSFTVRRIDETAALFDDKKTKGQP